MKKVVIRGPVMTQSGYGVHARQFVKYAMKKKDGTLKVFTNDIDFNDNLNNIKEEKRKKKRFKYELTNNSVYLSKFLNLFK